LEKKKKKKCRMLLTQGKEKRLIRSRSLKLDKKATREWDHNSRERLLFREGWSAIPDKESPKNSNRKPSQNLLQKNINRLKEGKHLVRGGPEEKIKNTYYIMGKVFFEK